jgi:hypothetical protein
MGRIDDTVWCDGCGGEIFLSPRFCKDREFCCRDCADGLRCWCGILWFEDEDHERENPRPWPGERGLASCQVIQCKRG